MLIEQIERYEAIKEFVKTPSLTEKDFIDFLTKWAGHPDYYADVTGRVIKNLAVLNIKLLNELTEEKRFSLVNAVCLAVDLVMEFKQWEYMLSREDGDWYWNNYGLIFAGLHLLIPSLNELQKSISDIAPYFTGRIICVEGPSEHVFLNLLYGFSRISQYNVPRWVYGGKDAKKNLVHYMRDKNHKGVRVDLAYDRDGSILDDKDVQNLDKQVTIQRKFAFSHDFESSFPPELLSAAVTDYLKKFKDATLECSVSDVEALLKRGEGPKKQRKAFVAAVEENYDIEISKPQLAEFLFIHFAELGTKYDPVFTGAGEITGTELSKFLRFVMDWPEEVSPEENDPGAPAFFPSDTDKQKGPSTPSN